jgi:hypothetical protein
LRCFFKSAIIQTILIFKNKKTKQMPHKLQNHDSNIITEDDPQGGVDHVDAHQSMLMMAGRYVNKGYVSHTHANFGAILKTIDWRKIEKDPGHGRCK